MAFYFVRSDRSAARFRFWSRRPVDIFGVSAIVNFAHGAFYMLGAYVAFTLTERFFRRHRLLGGLCRRMIVAVIGCCRNGAAAGIYSGARIVSVAGRWVDLMVEDLSF